MSGTSAAADAAALAAGAEAEDRQQRQGDAEQLQPATLEADAAARRILDDPGGGDRPARVARAALRSCTGQGE